MKNPNIKHVRLRVCVCVCSETGLHPNRFGFFRACSLPIKALTSLYIAIFTQVRKVKEIQKYITFHTRIFKKFLKVLEPVASSIFNLFLNNQIPSL